MTPVSLQKIMSKRTARGGWTAKQLAEWGVPWPPPQGWKRRLQQGKPETHDGLGWRSQGSRL
jgi:hypothetical protein